jgi:hypothetical protein
MAAALAATVGGGLLRAEPLTATAQTASFGGEERNYVVRTQWRGRRIRLFRYDKYVTISSSIAVFKYNGFGIFDV